jgi:hypothetical protein
VLIAEDLLLLLLDDDSGASQTQWMKQALGGALLVELALAGNVVVGESRWWRAGRVRTVPEVAAPEDPVLAEALDTIARKPRRAQDLVNRLGKDQQQTLTGRLVDRGLLERRESRVLGLFPRTRWPARDVTHEDQVRRALSAALAEGQDPDQRTAALIALLSALDRAHKTIDRGPVSARDVKRRAKQIADGDWAAKAVKDAIQAATAAMTAATAGGAAAAASSST